MSEEKSVESELEAILKKVRARDPHQKEFLQAASEVLVSLLPLFEKDPKYLKVVEPICEPERVVQFKVHWIDDKGNQQVNRGYRCQFNQAIGPYKGGLKFRNNLAETFKNSLTTLPMGGGKGGSDFHPRGKSDLEVMRFCRAFMTELYRHIGPDTDVPAGDIGVGGREIGYLYGQYKKITNTHVGVLTGKGFEFGGSRIRPEATGYGVIYSLLHVLNQRKDSIKGKKVLISGAGNVATFAALKANSLGALVMTLSDSSGTVHEPEGFTLDQLNQLFAIKARRGRCHEYLKVSKTAKYYEKGNPWAIPADVAIPCATQNEILLGDAENLIKGGVQYLIEAANMPSTNEAIDYFREKRGAECYFPAKAANAGGVAVSGLEMSQNSLRLQWTRKEVDDKLKGIMASIFEQCKSTSEKILGKVDYQFGANAAGFKKVADAMFQQGYVF